MPTLAYEIVDVFTTTPFAGNPLAVVLDADDLPTEDLQRLAREFNLSETAFPMAVTPQGHALRIFTPTTELPFAGHPSLGAAWVLARLGRLAAPGLATQRTLAGEQPLALYGDGSVEVTGAPPGASGPIDHAPLLAAAGLAPDDSVPELPARTAGAGLPFAFLPVRADAVARARAGGDVVVVHWDAAARTAHVRVFVASLGVGEDPATGAAAVGLGAFLAASGELPDGESDYTVQQGTEIGRPSTLFGRAVVREGTAVRCGVRGSVVPIARGEILRP